jgi:hypothetical protein
MKSRNSYLFLSFLLWVLLGVWLVVYPGKGWYSYGMSRIFKIGRDKGVKTADALKTSWIVKACSFTSSRVLISDFEHQRGEKREWVGNNVTLYYEDHYHPISGKAYLRMRVNGGTLGSMVKTFEPPPGFQ